MGFDSSIVTCLSAEVNSRLNTFTVIFPNQNQFNESKYAKIISDHYSTNHTEIPVQELSNRDLYSIIKQFDEPLADSSSIPTAIVSNVISKQFKVAIGGDGADELFGGYMTNNREYFLNKFFSLFRGKIPPLLIKSLLKTLPTKLFFFDHMCSYY